jgi:hypothetical protein
MRGNRRALTFVNVVILKKRDLTANDVGRSNSPSEGNSMVPLSRRPGRAVSSSGYEDGSTLEEA